MYKKSDILKLQSVYYNSSLEELEVVLMNKPYVTVNISSVMFCGRLYHYLCSFKSILEYNSDLTIDFSYSNLKYPKSNEISVVVRHRNDQRFPMTITLREVRYDFVKHDLIIDLTRNKEKKMKYF